MNSQIDFYYDFGSPAAYLAWTQLPRLCAETGAELVLKPILLGGLFKATGNQTPVAIEAKGQWMFADMERFAARYGVPYAMNPHFIINTLPLMRGAMWAKGQGCLKPYNTAMFEAVWVDQKNMNDPVVIMSVLADAGIDAQEVADAIQTPDVKQALIDDTAEAVDRGAFGVPTMFVGGVMHFGQDRLDWVREALR